MELVVRSISATTGPRCRICLSGTNCSGQHLITPCKCAGTMGTVHNSCLEKWASLRCSLVCEICETNYAGKYELKYNYFTSVWPFIKDRWSGQDVLMFFQAMFLLTVLLIEVGEQSAPGMNLSHQTTTFLVWASLTFAMLAYFMGYRIAYTLNCWNCWRRSQVIFEADEEADADEQLADEVTTIA